jgi:hypothetical protein
VQPQAVYLTSLCLHSLLRQMKVIIIIALHKTVVS